LLSEISIEQLQLWADEVPYAAIIHQLMAMKVVQEEHTPASREILQRATLQSPNPDRLSRQLHRLASDVSKSDISHTHPDEAVHVSTTAIVEPDLDNDDTIHLPEEIKEDDYRGLNKDERKIPPSGFKGEEPAYYQEDTEEDENELSDFSQWLSGLKKVNHEVEKKEKGSSILEGHTDIASETLAELLVKQGHTTRAIEMYEQLSLKYPKKSSFFAGQIQKIQGL